MKAVLDTNVVISALLKRDTAPRFLLDAWYDHQFDILTSPRLLKELKGVIERPKISLRSGFSTLEATDLLRALSDTTAIRFPKKLTKPVVSDPPDNELLALAQAGDADYIVTGDAELLQQGTYGRVRIVTTSQFATILSRKRRRAA